MKKNVLKYLHLTDEMATKITKMLALGYGKFAPTD